MKRLFCTILVSWICFSVIGCKKKEYPPREELNPWKPIVPANEVAERIYDSPAKMVYIMAKEIANTTNKGNEIIFELMAQKLKWQTMFPEKKVISATVVSTVTPLGLLIFYE